jgi:hypothetical protein
MLPAADHPLPGFEPVVDDGSLVATFYLPRPLASAQAEVLSRKRHATLPARNGFFDGVAGAAPRDLLVDEIDLDNDGRADLAVIELLDPDGTRSPDHSRRWQFVNVDGRWWYAGEYQLYECD